MPVLFTQQVEKHNAQSEKQTWYTLTHSVNMRGRQGAPLPLEIRSSGGMSASPDPDNCDTQYTILTPLVSSCGYLYPALEELVGQWWPAYLDTALVQILSYYLHILIRLIDWDIYINLLMISRYIVFNERIIERSIPCIKSISANIWIINQFNVVSLLNTVLLDW